MRRSSTLALVALAAMSACNDDIPVVNVVPITPAPTLFSINPGEGTVGTTVVVTLTGNAFVIGATQVHVTGIGISVLDVSVRIDGMLLTANFVISGTAAMGARTVTVSTPNGSSNALTFNVFGGPRFLDLGSVIRDTKTNLFWEKKTNAGSDGLHDVGTTYSWCAATGNADAGTPCVGNAESWIADVNAEHFGGFADWRVPTQQELESILSTPCPGGGAACIDPLFGPTSTASPYWSSTVSSFENAIALDFANGAVVQQSKALPTVVRAVRSGQ